MTDDDEKQLEEVMAGFAPEASNLIPALQATQRKLGYLPEEAMSRLAHHLKVPESTVFGVSTFYSQFKMKPSGRKVIRVCRGTACHVRGSAQVLQELENRLKIKPGETTPDLEYTLETVACIGACALAPTMTINEDVFGHMSTKKVAEVLSGKQE